MKFLLRMAVLALLLDTNCEASVEVSILAPFDDADVKFALRRDEATKGEIEADRKVYRQLEEWLRLYRESELKAFFEPAQRFLPAGYVLPVHHSAGMGFSGLGYRGDGESYFLHVGDVGGLVVFPCGADDSVAAVALYLKTDSAFTAIRSPTDYPIRRQWELERTAVLRDYIRGVLIRDLLLR